MENYEEKYKHALENFKKIKSANSDNKELVNFIEYEYPELNKSENERIKRCIQVALIDVDEKRFNDYDTTLKDCLFWLEKQGEQHNVWNVEDEHNLKAALGYIEDEYLRRWFKDIVYAKFEKQDEQRSWSEEDEKLYNSALWHIKNSCGNGGKDSGEYEVYNWLKSLKDRVQPQPKQEWSEEDEKCRGALINICLIPHDEMDGRPWGKWANWLKSIKPNHWKPSEYDISLLEEIARNIRNNVRPFCSEVSALEDLIENLKTL